MPEDKNESGIPFSKPTPIVLCYLIAPFIDEEMRDTLDTVLPMAYSHDYRIVKDVTTRDGKGGVFHFLIALPYEDPD